MNTEQAENLLKLLKDQESPHQSLFKEALETVIDLERELAATQHEQEELRFRAKSAERMLSITTRDLYRVQGLLNDLRARPVISEAFRQGVQEGMKDAEDLIQERAMSLVSNGKGQEASFFYTAADYIRSTTPVT